jgi:hypothetical protein
MLIFLIFLLIIFIGTSTLIFLNKIILGNFWKQARNVSFILFIIIMTIGLILSFIYKTEELKYKSFIHLTNELRVQEYDLKSISITMKIIEINEGISKAKYLEKTIWSLFIPDSYSSLELLTFAANKKIKPMEKSL